jgi:pyrroline-5-carboxylate reductase
MDLTKKRVAIVGAGNMGVALMKGMIDSNAVPPANIIVSNKRKDKSRALAEKYGVGVAESNAQCAKDADVVLLAVKPQIFTRVLEEIREVVPNALLISVAAGISTRRIETVLGGSPRVIRSMPNTPAVIKEGATAISAGLYATESDVKLAETIFQKVGRVAVVDEVHLDAVCGHWPFGQWACVYFSDHRSVLRRGREGRADARGRDGARGADDPGLRAHVAADE